MKGEKNPDKLKRKSIIKFDNHDNHSKKQKKTIQVSKNNRYVSLDDHQEIKRKRNDSSDLGLNAILKKYQLLEEKYSQILEDFKQRNKKYDRQKREIQFLRHERENDKKLINQLRGRLGFVKNVSVSTQTEFTNFLLEGKQSFRKRDSPKSSIRKRKVQQQTSSFNFSPIIKPQNQSTKTLPSNQRYLQNIRKNEEEFQKNGVRKLLRCEGTKSNELCQKFFRKKTVRQKDGKQKNKISASYLKYKFIPSSDLSDLQKQLI